MHIHAQTHTQTLYICVHMHALHTHKHTHVDTHMPIHTDFYTQINMHSTHIHTNMHMYTHAYPQIQTLYTHSKCTQMPTVHSQYTHTVNTHTHTHCARTQYMKVKEVQLGRWDISVEVEYGQERVMGVNMIKLMINMWKRHYEICYYDQLVLLITEEPNESQNIILINIFFCVHYKIFYVILFPEMFLVLYNRKVILLWWSKLEESIKLLFYKTVHRTHGLAAKWFRIQDLKGNKAFLTTISLIVMHGNYSRTKYQIITFQGNINAIHILNIY